MVREITPLEQIKALLQNSRETYRSENTNERDTVYAYGEENAYVNVLNIAGDSLKDAEKNKEVLDLLFRKGVNIILLDYLHHMNPDNAFETYNKEMRKAWCDLYELNRDQFNMIVDYIEERKRK